MTASQNQKRVIQSIVPPEQEGIRLDLYLQKRFTYRSRASWQNAVRHGEIRLNGTQTRPSRVLHAGEIISFQLEEQEEPDVCTQFKVLLETPDFLAVDKPGDLPVHPAGRFFRNTLSELLRPHYGEVFPVNRLDRETSGIVLLARTGKSAGELAALFSKKTIQKRYLAIVHGAFPAFLHARGFLWQDHRSQVRKKRRFTESPPPDTESCETAETEFRLLRSAGPLSLIECFPATGRLHQIRATLFAYGFPLAGDKLYGLDDSFYLRYIQGLLTDDDRTVLLLSRQALHAESLAFRSPFDGQSIKISAQIPHEFDLLLQNSLSGCIVAGNPIQ